MYCTKCGKQNDDNAYKCVQCGNILARPAVHASSRPQQSVPNYLVQAILVTIFCCLPCGIAAIVFAAQVNSKVAAGDYEGAFESSKKAKMWCWISFGIGLAGTIIYAMIMLLGMIAGFMS